MDLRQLNLRQPGEVFVGARCGNAEEGFFGLHIAQFVGRLRCDQRFLRAQGELMRAPGSHLEDLCPALRPRESLETGLG